MSEPQRSKKKTTPTFIRTGGGIGHDVVHWKKLQCGTCHSLHSIAMAIVEKCRSNLKDFDDDVYILVRDADVGIVWNKAKFRCILHPDSFEIINDGKCTLGPTVLIDWNIKSEEAVDICINSLISCFDSNKF